MIIAVFFTVHWFASLFSQTFFLHRYSAHKMFTMPVFWERFFYFTTFISQGSSFLNPRAYAVMHRMHHAFSDTEQDPHSPHFFKDVFRMMMQTKTIYMDLLHGRNLPDQQFLGNYPEWHWLDQLSNSWIVRVLWGVLYTVFYYIFVPAGFEWLYLLLPVHFLMGPIHGAIVNWCGHKYGYSNYDNHDYSRNTLFWDVLLMGELFQNNHHKDPNRPNFAFKWFELDPTYPIMKGLELLRIIRLRRSNILS